MTWLLKHNIIIEINCLLMVPLAWFGSCAIGRREPCQVRKEAAISGSSYVPQRSLLLRLAELSKGNLFLLIGAEERSRERKLYVHSTCTEPIVRRCSTRSSDRSISSKILKNQIATDAVSHAYLFCGTRGTGQDDYRQNPGKGSQLYLRGGAALWCLRQLSVYKGRYLYGCD